MKTDMRTKFSCLAGPCSGSVSRHISAPASGATRRHPNRHPATQQPAQTPPSPAPPPRPAAGPGPERSQPSAGRRPTGHRPVFRVGVNEVNLIFTVTDKHGHYVPNLKQSDFALLDDQKAPAKSPRSASRSICRFVSASSSTPAPPSVPASSSNSSRQSSSSFRFSRPEAIAPL